MSQARGSADDADLLLGGVKGEGGMRKAAAPDGDDTLISSKHMVSDQSREQKKGRERRREKEEEEEEEEEEESGIDRGIREEEVCWSGENEEEEERGRGRGGGGGQQHGVRSWRMMDKLGKGFCGSVYEAYNVDSRRKVWRISRYQPFSSLSSSFFLFPSLSLIGQSI